MPQPHHSSLVRHGHAATLPVLILAVVGAIQVVLTKTAGLSPWKGGGFGMFSTSDDTARRQLRILVSAQDRSEELEIAPSLADAAARAAAHPGDRQLSRLAKAVVARERRHGRAVSTVRLECLRVEYAAGTLTATTVLIRAYTYRVPASE